MSIKKRFLITAAIIFAVALISGLSIMAATNFGTQSDPLVTLSYLTSKYKPEIIGELRGDINTAAEKLTKDFDAKLKDAAAGPGGSSGTAQNADEFSLVTLTKNKTVTCSIGAEILLRIGTAEGVGASPALVNSTAGATLSPGAALTANNMYLVTIEGNGIKATADTVMVMIRGGYTIK